MKKCASCGKIIKGEAGEKYCRNCVDENGNLKSYEQVSENLAKYLRDTQGLDARASINAAKAIVSSQPVWEKKQGVYFEGDMKRSRRLVVSLIVIIALILAGIGINFYENFLGNKELPLLSGGESQKVNTRNVGDVRVKELMLPGSQNCPKQLYEHDQNIICFTSPRFSKSGNWLKKTDLYGFNTHNNHGFKLTFDIKQFTKVASSYFPESVDTTMSSTHFTRDGMWITTTRNTDKNGDKWGIKAVTASIDVKHFYPELFPTADTTKELGFYRHYNNFIKKEANWLNLYFLEKRQNIHYPILLDGYITWFENDDSEYGFPNIKRIVLYNLHTEREITVTETVFNDYYKLNDRFIVWLDNRKINAPAPSIYCYDIKSGEEFVVYENVHSQYFTFNDSYIIFSKDDNTNLHLVYDLNNRKLTNKHLTKNIYQEPRMSDNNNDYDYKPENLRTSRIKMSKGSENKDSFIAYSEIEGEEESYEGFKGRKLKVFVENISKDNEVYEVYGDDESISVQVPLKITDDFVIWQSLNYETYTNNLWIGRISDGQHDGIIESVLIDTSAFEENTFPHLNFGDVEVTEKKVFWTKTDTNSNICWAVLSNIFKVGNNEKM